MALSIEMLPAAQGDALWLEYGPEQARRRILVDGGTKATAERVRQRILQLPEAERRFELLIVSHIDNDHIGGVVPLLEDPPPGLAFNDIWFNGFQHLPKAPLEPLGAVEGDKLTKLLAQLPWNEAFAGAAVVVPAEGELPAIELAGGLRLTLLSPYAEQLAKLRPLWEPVAKAHGLLEGVEATAAPEVAGIEALGPPPTPEQIDVAALAAAPFKCDGAEPNGTSIAVLAEDADGRSALLCADAFPTVLLQSLERHLPAGERLRVSAFKLPHHGSRANLHSPLVRRIEAPLHLISTDGTQTHHPNPEAIARVVASGGAPELIFNYRTQWNEVWDDAGLRERAGYSARFPAAGVEGIAVALEPVSG